MHDLPKERNEHNLFQKTDSKFSSKDHVKNAMLVGCRPNYNLKLNVRITTLLDLVPSSAMVYCTLNNLQHKCEWFKIGGKEQWPNGG
jgi:hypothetical protein